MDKFAIEMRKLSKKDTDTFNLRQMDSLKRTVGVERTNRNALLRLMFKTEDITTLQKIRGLGLLKKNYIMKEHLPVEKNLQGGIII